VQPQPIEKNKYNFILIKKYCIFLLFYWNSRKKSKRLDLSVK